jgi:hypothetical protein
MKARISLWASSVFIAIFSVSPIAKAAEVVTMQCSIFGPNESIHEVNSSISAQLPPSVIKGASCSQAVADLLNAEYTLEKSFAVQQFNSDYAGPYYLFIKY